MYYQTARSHIPRPRAVSSDAVGTKISCVMIVLKDIKKLLSDFKRRREEK